MFDKIVWLTGMPRSGTNWASQIFASHPDVRVKFCPLFSYAFKNACDENSTPDDWRALFEAVYVTQDAYLDQEYLRKDGLVPGFAEKASAPRILCIKSTRYHHLTRALIERVPNLQVVALVRNPAASIHSWLTNPHEFPAGADPQHEWRSGTCRKTGVGEFWGFDDWTSVTRTQLALAQSDPARLKIVVYEDLVRDALSETGRLFKWLGLDIPAQTRDFIKASQSSHQPHKRAVFKDPSVHGRWMDEIDPDLRYTIGKELVGSPLARFCDPRTLAVGAGWRGKAAPRTIAAPKTRLEDLAAFGGTPLFDKTNPRPFGQLTKPSWPVFSRHVDTIYESRRLSNNGQLGSMLERQLAELHRVEYCVVYANATLALIVLLNALKIGKRRTVIVPAFTYVGLPHIIRWAGLEPEFCDVNEATQTLSPVAAEELVSDETAAILAVHQVNAPCDHAAFAALSRRTGVPVVYDSVHALGCTLPDGAPIGGLGVAEIFSLHATKILNAFEGGYVTTNDAALAERLRSQRNFGYSSEVTTNMLGMNGKLNEIHAAAALASISELPAELARNKQRFERYQETLAGIDGLSLIAFEDSYRDKNYEFALLVVDEDWPLGRDETVNLLRAENALARAYYNEPLFRYDDYPKAGSTARLNVPRDVTMPFMPVTDALARRIILLPVGDRVSLDDIDAIAGWFRFVRKASQQIAPRMRASGERVW